jgi:chitodextrinase
LLRWSGVSDAASGLSTTNGIGWSTARPPRRLRRCANGTPIFVGAAGQFEHQNVVAGTRYYYRLCATDKAGNVSMGAVAFAVAR